MTASRGWRTASSVRQLPDAGGPTPRTRILDARLRGHDNEANFWPVTYIPVILAEARIYPESHKDIVVGGQLALWVLVRPATAGRRGTYATHKMGCLVIGESQVQNCRSRPPWS